MKITKVKWIQLGVEMQMCRAIELTLEDGTVLGSDDEQKPIIRGEDVALFGSANVPEEWRIDADDPTTTDHPEIIGLVSEFMAAVRNGTFEEKVELR